PFHKPAADRVTPDLGVPLLKLESLQHFAVALFVDVVFELPPLVHQPARVVGTLVMQIIELLNECFARVQSMRVRDVMHKQQQILWTASERFKLYRNRRTVLAEGRGA